MHINGTNKSDTLYGTSGDDDINGRKGRDWIEGGKGNDHLTGGDGPDTFVLRAGDGHDVVTDFNPAEGDRVLFDYGTYSDVMFLGALSDGLTWQNATHTATFTVSAVDANHDGVGDTTITANSDSITLLGWSPQDLMGWALQGG